ncbi:MAG TPA: hypothetical protein VGK03_08270 [Geothrix sp.]|jgi:hypothetical protein
MKRAEAEKLLGGYATGTLTESERRMLFEAALEHQDLFDALADEEALRELLADPAARAHVLAALAPSSEGAPPKIVPFWRRPGVIGAAAGLLVATTAGLVVLRSPEGVPPLAKPEVVKAIPEAASAPAAPEAKGIGPAAPKVAARSKVAPGARPATEAQVAGNLAPASAVAAQPPPPAQVVGAAAPAEEARARAQAERYQMEARDQLSKKAEVAGMDRAAAVMEVVSPAPPAPARRVAAKAAASPAAMSYASQAAAPVWTLEALPDGSTRVTVMVSRQAHVALLRRGGSGVEALKPAAADDPVPWRFQLRLASGDALDLYVLNGPVGDPARLPEAGPVDGFRVRIHPAAKKDAPR